MADRRFKLWASFFAVYVIWGSTYLAIRFAIETLPGFLMAGVRFMAAGGILFLWAWFRGASRPTWGNWVAAAIVGALLLVGGNGGVVWAEQRVPSGLTALLVATEPAWVAVFDWLRPGGRRPHWKVAAGLLAGFAGVSLLVSPADFIGGGRVDPAGAAVLVLATIAWAAGSLYTARGARLPKTPMMATGMQMLAGGAFLFLLGSASGEWAGFNVSAVSLKSVLALLYLLVFGAIVGFTAYIYLLQNTTPAKASTYAFVNPGIAVLLGWLFAGETLSLRVLFATLTIIAGVVLMTSHQSLGTTGEYPVAVDPPLSLAAGGPRSPRRRDLRPVAECNGPLFFREPLVSVGRHPLRSFSMRARLLFLLMSLSLASHRASAQTAADTAAIRQTALDYIEGWYEGNADRMARAVHGDLAKQIVTRGRPGAHEYVRNMSATELVEGTRAGGGTQTPAEKRRKDVTILDITYGKAASVKVIASDWVDLLHIAKVDGQWKIVNVLWERTPAP